MTQYTINQPILFGSRIVHHSNVIWKGHIYTDPNLKSYDGQLVNITELETGLLVTNQISQRICIAKHIAQVYAAGNFDRLPKVAIQVIKHGDAYIGKGEECIITEEGHVLPIHPKATKKFSKKTGIYPCIYTTTLVKENNITQPYAHWVEEEK